MKDKAMKYYMYVSESKVDMLYAQIPKSARAQIEAELKIDLQYLNIAFTRKQFEDTLYSKLGVVTEYIEKHIDTGSISMPREYFKGTANLRWMQIHEGVVFWGGIIHDTALGLGGSSKYLLGNSSRDVEQGGVSHTPWLVSTLIKELQLNIFEPQLPTVAPKEQEYRAISATNWWAEELSNQSTSKFEFIAKKLASGTLQERKVLLGTPIYMALAG